MANRISDETIEYVGILAKLELSDTEKEAAKADMEKMLDYIDTLKIARKMLPNLKSKKLGMIAQHFNFNTDGMHRGLKDCIVTNMCYQKFVQMHREEQLKQTNALGLIYKDVQTSL